MLHGWFLLERPASAMPTENRASVPAIRVRMDVAYNWIVWRFAMQTWTLGQGLLSLTVRRLGRTGFQRMGARPDVEWRIGGPLG